MGHTLLELAVKKRPNSIFKALVLSVIVWVGYLSYVDETFRSSLTVSFADRDICEKSPGYMEVRHNQSLPSSWISCFPGETIACVSRNLTFNLFSATNAGHFLLDDFLNIILFRPEKVCNVKHKKMLEGLLEYEPIISIAPCEEDFPYFGYYQTQTLHYQVRNRVRLVKYTEPQLQSLFEYFDEKIGTRCPALEETNNVLFIGRHESYGRAFDERLVPTGVKSMYIDNAHQSMLDVLCEVAQFSLVIVPHGSETVFPIVLKKQFIALTNDWKSDTFYYEAIASGSTTHAFLHMNSTPSSKKPTHPYYNNFSPTSRELDELSSLIKNYRTREGFTSFEFRVKGTSSEKGLFGEILYERKSFLESKGKS
jgi:hypothetical protein